MKHSTFSRIICSPILLGMALLSCHRPIITGKSWFNHKITRFRCKDIHKTPFVFGTIYIKDEKGVHQWPASFIRVEDERLSINARTDGTYGYSLPPGKHEILAYQAGYTSVKINKITLHRGDSVKIDFLLHVDPEANIY